MRSLVLIPIALLAGACWTPGPGQRDPSRYPWDPVNRAAAQKPQGTYCVVARYPPGGGGPMKLGCTPPRPARRTAPSADPQDQLIWILCASPPHERQRRARRETPPKSSCGTKPEEPVPTNTAQAPLGPAYEYRQVASDMFNRIKLREPTAEEMAGLELRHVPVGRTLAELTPAEMFAKQCADYDDRLRDMANYRVEANVDGTALIEDAGRWHMLPQDDKRLMIWAIAFRASCAAGKRKMVDVRIFDLKGRLLNRQLASTELACHGDGIGGPVYAPWYLC